VVLLHDSLGCVDLWRDFPERLAGRLARPVIAYDRLGFGRSSARHELPSVNFIREEAEVYFPTVRRALGVAEYALFGHSVGGAMALLIAASPEEPCRAVVSESAQAFVEDCTLAGIRQAREQFERPEQLAKLARWHGDKAGWVLRAWTDVWLSPEFAAWGLGPDLPRVRCPVLALHGDQDEYGSVAFPRLIGSRAGGPSEVAVLEGCGHVPHRERPDDVLDRVAVFLGRATGRHRTNQSRPLATTTRSA
jgi:pimeloyl-ACP methyl ester carboxylesterase